MGFVRLHQKQLNVSRRATMLMARRICGDGARPAVFAEQLTSAVSKRVHTDYVSIPSRMGVAFGFCRMGFFIHGIVVPWFVVSGPLFLPRDALRGTLFL